MSDDHLSLTQKWLRQNIQAYSRREIVYNHVDTVLAAYPTLRPKTDVYTYDDGRSQLLLCVHGLLPILYRQASYNIPISVWLAHEYPTRPPLVYVVPTSDMLVKAGKSIDVSGRCEPPYILAWQRKSEGCDLKGLVQALTDQFSREPPVYAKPQAGSSPPPRPRERPSSGPATPDYSSRPPPAAPGIVQPNGSPSSPSPVRRPAPPPRPPPIPDLSTRPPTQSPPPTVSHHNYVPRQNASVYYSPPSVTSSTIPQEPPIYSTPPVHRQQPPHSHIHNTSAIHGPPPLQGPPNTYLPPEHAPQRWSLPPASIPPQPTGPSSSPHVPYQPTPMQIPPTGPPLPPPIHPVLPTVPPTSARNLLDEDVDDNQSSAPPPSNAPPRPPNPEILRLHAEVHAKFTSEFAALDRALATDMQRLRTAQSDLLAGEPAIRDEMARLEAVRDVCRVVGGRFRSTVGSAEMNLNEMRRKGDPEVDELICSTTIVYNQLIDLVAEDNAIEDTIYHLHRALNAGRIDLDKFLRTTRSLAEEQFMKRALAEKIVALIPMGAWT